MAAMFCALHTTLRILDIDHMPCLGLKACVMILQWNVCSVLHDRSPVVLDGREALSYCSEAVLITVVYDTLQ
jgi:hypothetical protein